MMSGIKTVLISIIANILLSCGKITAGLLGKSIVLISDGIHSLSDLITDFICLITIIYSKKPVDRTHPYGHKRFESIGSFLLGISLIAGIIWIIFQSFTAFIEKDISSPSLKIQIWLLLWAIITIPVKEILFRITKKSGEKENSDTLKANAWHHRSDALTSLIAFLAILSGIFFPGVKNIIEIFGSLAILIFVGKIGVDYFLSGFNALVDRSPSQEFLNTIIKKTVEIPEILSVEEPKVRNLGGEFWVDLHIRMDGKLSLEKAHEISHKVKNHIIKNIPSIVEVMIHTEPEDKYADK